MFAKLQLAQFSQRAKRTLGVLGTLGFAAIFLAACQPQFQTPSDILFAPTFNKSQQNIPSPYNTPYDCRHFSGSGWKGIAGGEVSDFDRRNKISYAACFKTEAECQSYLVLMRQYIDMPTFMGCRPHNG